MPSRRSLTTRQFIVLVGGLLLAAVVGVATSPTVLSGAGIFIGVVVVLGALFLLLLVEETEWAVLFLLAGRASLDLVAGQRVGPLNVAAVLGLLVIATAVIHLWGSRTFPGTDSPVFPYVLFLGVAALSLVASPEPIGALKDLFRFTSLLAIFILVGQITRTEGGLRRVIVALAVSGIGPILAGAYQLVSGAGMEIKQGGFVRIEGTFVHPNPFALYLALLVPTLVAAAIAIPRWRRWLIPIVAGLLACLVFTFTRTGWIGLVAALLVMAFLRYRKVLLLAPIILAALLFLVPGIADRFSDLGSTESPSGTTTNSLDWRFEYWQEALGAVGESPLWGQGLGYIKETTTEGKEAHNDFVRIVVETGLAGLALFVWAMARLVRRTFTAVGLAGSPLRRAIRVAFAGTMAAYLLMSLTSNLISQPAVQWYFWAIMAVALGDVDPDDADSWPASDPVPDAEPAVA